MKHLSEMIFADVLNYLDFTHSVQFQFVTLDLIVHVCISHRIIRRLKVYKTRQSVWGQNLHFPVFMTFLKVLHLER